MATLTDMAKLMVDNTSSLTMLMAGASVVGSALCVVRASIQWGRPDRGPSRVSVKQAASLCAMAAMLVFMPRLMLAGMSLGEALADQVWLTAMAPPKASQFVAQDSFSQPQFMEGKPSSPQSSMDVAVLSQVLAGLVLLGAGGWLMTMQARRQRSGSSGAQTEEAIAKSLAMGKH